MKNEKKTASVLILIFPGKNALWNHRKSLKNGSAKLFVSLRKFNHTFFWLLLHTPHQKLLTKKKRVLFVDESFNFSLFSRVLRVKNSMPIPFPWSFWLVMWKCTTKQECFHIKNEKHLETRLHSIRALNPRPDENLQLYKKLAKKRFLKSSFWISHLILNLIPRVSCLQNSFDDNEGLLCGQHCQEGKGPGDVKLSTNRQF